MSTLKGLFESPKPKSRRNFILENVRHLREAQSYVCNKEEMNTVSGRPRTNKFENMPAKVPSYINGSQSKKKKKQSTTEASMRISGVSELPCKTLGGIRSGSVLPRVGITHKEHARAKDSIPKRNGPGRYTNSAEILSDHVAESVHRQSTDLSRKVTKEVASCTELSLDMSDISSVDIASEPIEFTGSRSVGCQTVDPKNFEELYNVGVIKYPSTRKIPGTKLRHSEKKLPTFEMEQQTDRAQSRDNRIHNTTGDRLIPDGSDDPDIQKLSLYEHKQDVHEHQEVGPGTDYIKMNVMSVKARQRTVEAASDPLKPPSTYQKGVIPKYLQERREALQKEAEKQERDVPDPACPPGHVTLQDSDRKETLRMLEQNYGDLIQKLNMMPVRTDTLKMRNRKIELEQKLNKIEEGIKVFSRPKVFVKIGA
ncbi:hypothetical protein B7P43_G13858 [Cryptotermes secundus]|uniref:Enkurin domain-containing protein n=4 Tax=Cryptotermes secundus TaxID=105785 RepID=A0A2J7QHC8_9NEOP|nr:uncharacterized protein LOC111867517 isoform X2 [Cryptotermes secundus]XP_023713245.1 uncharacterized protein LOC111867517 isoform X2 [Cryptotermes secundus]XP_023713246.1 uncharacterized protein LOC111867517 isoform X2 [Cryptotermes secundus]PNF27998.1 hypothetical protein B7P43_G13858 [Cryptotermes secundus]